MENIEKEISVVYDKIANVYHEYRSKNRLFWNEFIEKPAMLSLLKSVKSKRILDLGCGSGIHARLLKNRGANIYGIDISPRMIEIAKANVRGVDFRVGSVYELPYKSRYFDIVVSSYVVEHFEDLDAAFKEVKRVLKKRGLFIFSIGNPVTGSAHHIKGKPDTLLKFGDYFNEEKHTSTWAMRRYRVKIPWFRRTYETWIKAIVKNGFVIEDYIDARPPARSKKVDRKSYEYASKVPQVCVFKVKVKT